MTRTNEIETADPGGSAVSASDLPALHNGPRCPRCRNRRLWATWFDMVAACPACGLALDRHNPAAVVWINTWATTLVVAGWIVAGLAVGGLALGLWVTLGAVVLAIATPIVGYRHAKAIALRLTLRFDRPHSEEGV